MRKLAIIFALFAGIMAAAQEDNSAFVASYQRQVRNVGVSGVGVQTIIERWEAALPNDPEAKAARFSYYFDKAHYDEVVQRDQKRYLGQKPILTLKDSLSVDVYYYSVVSFVDSLYAEAIKAIERAIILRDKELRYRFIKISALLSYEKESPDMACSEIIALIDECAGSKKGAADYKAWTLDGETLNKDNFVQGISEYCYTLFQTGSSVSYEYFKTISEKMSKLYPKETVFINNLGSYWLVAKDNPRKSSSYYKKVLKLDPDDYAAGTNLKLIEKKSKK